MKELASKANLAGNPAIVRFEDGTQVSATLGGSKNQIEIRSPVPPGVVAGAAAVIEIVLADGLYRFPSQLGHGDALGMWFAWPAEKDIIYQQRRQYYRVDVDLPAKVRVAGKDLPARMMNLSGGGARLLVTPPPAVDAMIEVTFELQKRPLTAPGKVLRVFNAERGDIAVIFVDIKPREQDRIVSFTFSNQRPPEKR